MRWRNAGAVAGTLYQPEIPASLLVARLQIEWHGEVFRQPWRQYGQWLTDLQRAVPYVEQSHVAIRPPATGRRIDGRWVSAERRVRSMDQSQEFRIKVEVPDRYQIDNDDRHVFAKKRRALLDELSAAFGSVLVRGADDFDCGYEATAMPGVVDANLILVLIFKFGFYSQRRR